MGSTLEKKENNKVTLKIEVSYEDFDKEIQNVYNRSRGKFAIPGFRKGKVPRKIIEANYGEGVFFEDAINGIFPKVYEEAIKEHKLDPIDRPSLDLDKIEKGQPVIFIVEVEVKPEVKLGEYKGIEVEKKEYNISDEDVENELKAIQEKNSRLIEIEDRVSKEGDTLTIDYSGFIGDEQFEGGTAKNQPLELGSNSFIPGFEEQLVGKNKGDEVDVKVSFPEEYHAPNLAGKEAIFKVKIHEIKEKELPELDDELAKDVSEFDTLDEFRADIKKSLEENAKKKEEAEFENSVVDKVSELTEVDVPEVLVERQIDNSISDFGYRLRFQGLELEKYLQMTGTSMEDFRGQFKEDAEKIARAELVLEAIGQKEGFEVSQEELDTELGEIAKQYGQDLAEVKKKFTEEDLDFVKLGIIKRKTVDFLVENAKAI